MSVRKKALIIILIPILLFVIFFTSMFLYLFVIPIDIDLTKLEQNENNVTLLDIDLNEIDVFADKYSTFDEIPDNLKNAFISIEDKRFYKHNGVDIIRICGALKNNLFHGTSQGGSTITQQLIKNEYLSFDKSMDRKIQEIRMAVSLEKQLSKNEILEKYLNMLYFGSGEYGIKNAAYRFFGKSLNELTIKECALLAGIVKSPTKYNPINNYENSIARSNIVLSKMFEQNLITKSEYENAKKETIIIKNDLIHNNLVSKYSEIVYFEASKALGVNIDDVPYMDIEICTFLNLDTQKSLYESMTNKDYKINDNTKSVGLILDNNTVGVSAYYSNINENIFDYLRAPGSTIKPFAIYAPALENFDYHLFTKINNTKTDFNGYSPSNYKNRYSNYATVLDALSYSYNIPSCEVLKSIGIDSSLQMLDKMNIPYDKNDNNLALALGGMTYGMNFLDLSSAYSMLANNGLYTKPKFVRYIRQNDKIIYCSTQEKQQIVSKETANLITIALQDCAQNGTASKLSNLDFDIASKTGTVSLMNKDYNSDIYNISYTTMNTILIWNGDALLPSYATGGGIPTIIAKDVLSSIYKTKRPSNFEFSDNIEEINLDSIDYMNNDYLLVSNNTPKKFMVKSYINSLKNNLKHNETFDNIDNVAIFNNELELNERLCYKVIQRNKSHDTTITDIKNKNGTFDLNNLTKNMEYIIIPYYFDDDNIEIVGLPYKFNTNILDKDQSLRFFQSLLQ